MSYMTNIYAELIIKGFKKIGDVPQKDREDVKDLLIKKGFAELAKEK